MNSKQILIVDDDQSIRSIFTFMLNQSGYSAITASTGEACLAILNSSHDVDLIFLDVNMPGMSGIETFKAIQAFDPSLIVVMMTGYSVDTLLNDAFALGAYGVIYKPFDVDEVMSIIDKISALPTLKLQGVH